MSEKMNILKQLNEILNVSMNQNYEPLIGMKLSNIWHKLQKNLIQLI